MPRSRSPSRSSASSIRRSRSPLSDREDTRVNEFRVHIAELPQGVQEGDVRKVFQRFGTVLDVWVAGASCFAFVVYKLKEEAQKAIDQMDGRYESNSESKTLTLVPCDPDPSEPAVSKSHGRGHEHATVLNVTIPT